MDINTVESLRTTYPDLVNQIEQEACTKERQRIQDIEDVALPGYQELINDAKFHNPIAAADVAMQIIATQKKQGGQFLVGRDVDVQNSGMNSVGDEAKDGIKDAEPDEIMAAIDKVLPETK